MTQSFNVPDSISSDDLQHLLNQREHDAQPDNRVDHLCDVAQAAIDLDDYELDGCDAALVHKIMMIHLAKQFLEFHNTAGLTVLNKDSADPRTQHCANAWQRDAGKFQAILAILDTIEITDDDFTLPVAK